MRNPTKNIAVCKSVSFSSCASVSNSSVTKNNKAANPKDKTNSNHSCDKEDRNVMPKVAPIKKQNPKMDKIIIFFLQKYYL